VHPQSVTSKDVRARFNQRNKLADAYQIEPDILPEAR
jgi:hypothetical protein